MCCGGIVVGCWWWLWWLWLGGAFLGKVVGVVLVRGYSWLLLLLLLAMADGGVLVLLEGVLWVRKFRGIVSVNGWMD